MKKDNDTINQESNMTMNESKTVTKDPICGMTVDQADESQELAYVDIDTFLASFSSSPPHVGMGMVRTSYGIDPYVAFIDLRFVHR